VYDDFDLSNLPRGNAFLTVVDIGRNTLDRYLNVDRPLIGSDTPARTPAQIAISKAATAWSNARGGLDEIPVLLDALPAQLAAETTNPDLTGQAKARNVTELCDRTRATLAGIATTVLTGLTRVDTILRTASTPAKPGDDPATEARIAGAKADLKMILDAVRADVNELGAKMAALLTRAIGDGDTATTWVLAGSRWPADYASTRISNLGESALTDVLGACIGEALDQLTGQDLGDVRRVYRAVISPDGTWAIETVLGQLNPLIDDVRDWTVSHIPDGSLIGQARRSGLI
jgi:cob(I)alamin adenosyltransferase